MSDSIQLEVVEDPRQSSINEKINLKLIEISDSLKVINAKIEDIELRLTALETP